MNSIHKRNILIIAEGYEEKPYIDKILSFPNINKDVYHIFPAVNAKGSGNIFARYQYEFQRNFYDLILIFCDVDKGSEEFLALVDKIGAFFIDKKSAIEVFVFANPVTLQIVLSHFGEVNINNISKKNNAPLVEALTGIKNYDAKDEQIKELISKINFQSLSDFKIRLKNISTDFKDIPSTNFLTFLERFEQEDSSWIDAILSLMNNK